MTTTETKSEAMTGEWDLNPKPTQNLPDVAAVPQDKQAFSLAVRRMLGLEDASDGEIELFFHVCHKSGLDPFNKEVYMIGRNTEVAQWEPVNEDEPDGQKRKVKRWVTKYTIQTAINGFRKRAREIADGKGIKYTQDQPMWCGDDGVWKEVWPEKTPPTAAKFTVYRDGEPYTFVAHYTEYVQMAGQPAAPNSMWAKMPRNQTRKCAEAGAIQAAFPDELGGLLLEDAVQDDIIVLDEDGAVQQPDQQPKTRRGGKGVGGLADRAAAAQREEENPTGEVVDGEVVEPGQGAGNDQSQGAEPSSGAEPQSDSGDQEPTDEVPKTAMRKAVEKRTFTLLGGIDPELSRDDRILVYRSIIGRADIESTNDLEDHEVAKVGDRIYDWRKGEGGPERLNNHIREIVNSADLAAMNKENEQ